MIQARDFAESDSPVALQHFGRGLRLVEPSVVQRRLALEIPCVDIRALLDEHFCYRRLVCMRRCVERCRPPMLVLILRIHICTTLEHELDGRLMPFPHRAMQGRRTILIAGANQGRVSSSSILIDARSPDLAAFMISLCGSGIVAYFPKVVAESGPPSVLLFRVSQSKRLSSVAG